jgi:2-polyprenyl-3-methyl-5-hydroxy-6-metoxy-1,4-benzoquinol methylase
MPRFVTKQDWIAVSGVADLHIRSLLDRQQFDDPLGIAAALGISSAAWPLFGLLWPSGQQLAARMAARPVRAGERILEVGCGLALASLVCHRRGADVTASDCHPLAEAFLRENLRLNALAPLPYRLGHWTAPAGAGGAHRVSGRFDLVIGSDLLYERDETGALASFIERHAMPACEVWIVDPNRGNRPAFTRALQGHGFVLEELRLDTAATPTAAAYKGRLLIYRR